MKKTNIQYLTHTWNPIAMRCTPVSAGCQNCWHLRMTNRMKANPVLKMGKMLAYMPSGRPYLDRTKMDEPLRMKMPGRIGVQFMGDLFYDSIPDGWIDEIFDVCQLAPQHKFFILTKRPARMRQAILRQKKAYVNLCNMWFGVSVEDQNTADERIPYLMNTGNINRWISAEPMLGVVDLTHMNVLQTHQGRYSFPYLEEKYRSKVIDYIDWVVCGAETGPKKRPMKWVWAKRLANQCKNANVPFFFKEPWGNAPYDLLHREYPDWCDCDSCKEFRAKIR